MAYFIHLVIYLFINSVIATKKPNIVFIIADDYGWGDVGFHGSQQVKTPNIDLLASNGIILNNYYTSPLCSPSRSAILTGYHPIHTGLQHDVIPSAKPYGVPLRYKLLPQYLKDFGYETHAVGKWHQGFFRREYLPTQRGFDTHFGYWTGGEDYWDRTSQEDEKLWGIDFRDNEEVVNLTKYNDLYSTDIYTEKAIDIINKSVKSSKPLFLYLSHQSVHSGLGHNGQRIQAPQQYIDRFKHIVDIKRRQFVGMVSTLDDSVGKVLAALHDQNILNKTIIIFTSDNGGATASDIFDGCVGSNWPLRGGKMTLLEGGIKANGFIWSPLLKKTYISNHLMHLTDWLPTIYKAIGGNTKDLGPIDGIDMWDVLNENLENRRKDLVHNIDPISGDWALRSGDYKLVSGISHASLDGWYLPPGEANQTDDNKFHKKSKVYKIFKQMNLNDIQLKQIILKCNSSLKTDCDLNANPCLFNIKSDPCEYNNLYQLKPDIVKQMLDLLNTYNASAVPPINPPDDDQANPIYHNNRWSVWQ